ncbi:uncharacterized protein LOC135618657 isoform X1 [Musa acuminata AAA Group]|uniref:SURP motif domain-containing protein n=1 Tax=Musa acuminata subsp. malaccensis TaxID=214687 RepID=A0A804K2J9_MUSAM|nr:PREDICTED: splicing factor, suppressor of white-apricot homolog isoform X1 [Musa acuminata subsp. malaccensis]
MDLAVEGRHALLFDDDATAAFVNARDALVPWSGDPALLIDRYDVRHLLDRIPPRPPVRAASRLCEVPAVDGVTSSQLDRERYLDLPLSGPDADPGGDDDARGSLSGTTKDSDGTYQAVPFSYGNTANAVDSKNSDSGLTNSCYRPPFLIPERLQCNLPPTEKLHQIIARTATFVSQHGGQSEIVLRVKQGDNPTFGFLMPDHHLHEYFRFLVEHPQLLKSDTSTTKAQEEENLEEKKDKMLASDSGALSLLGSFYGTAEDDDGSHEADTEVLGSVYTSIADIAAVPQKAEQPYMALEGKGEIKSLAAPVVSKDKTVSIKRKLPAKSTLVNGPYGKNARDGNPILPGLVEQPRSSVSGRSDVKSVLLEPPSFLKRMIDKIVEFILRNGKEFEAVLIEQDKTVGRFPFLLPSNQYHPYYLKVLEGARQGNTGSKKKVQADLTKESARDHNSSDLSEGWLYDPHRKEKFKMVIGAPKKEKHDQQPTLAPQAGVSVDEAAAIVLAATRGVSSANAHQDISRPELAAGRTHREATHASSLGSYSFLQGRESIPKPTSSHEEGTSLPSSNQQLSNKGSNTDDDVWIAKAIAKTAALVTSCEADSSEASLTKEQKLKAERLKRAKMFAAMIKSGDPLSKLTGSITAQNSSLEISAAGSSRSGAGSDLLVKEREGSSVPFDAEVSGRSKFQERESDHDVSEEYSHREKHQSCSRDLRTDDMVESHKQSKKRHRSEHSINHRSDKKHRKHPSSSKDKESRHRHKHHSSSEDENGHRKHSRSHRRHKDEGTPEEKERTGSDGHRKKHHRRSQRNHDTDEEVNTTILDQSEVPQKSNHQKVVNMPSAPTDAATEVSKDLRAKIRAMLLETL